jgi:alpha-glucosidase
MADTLWRQQGIFYQVYPRSFQDSDGNGIGDLEGIRRRLDYLCWLGIDALWISPINPSPMADFGYDITDYCVSATTLPTIVTWRRSSAAWWILIG